MAIGNIIPSSFHQDIFIINMQLMKSIVSNITETVPYTQKLE